MPQPVKPIPEGYHSITPYLIVKGAAKAIDFYVAAFGATELFRMARPDGRVGHAEIRIGDSVVMLADEHPEMGARSPQTIGGTPLSLLLYVPDVDAVVARAVAAGAQLTRPVADQFYGDRSGILTDPFGHSWFVSTHVEDVPPDELERRASAQKP
ncbi:VOC family protein [Anaeromyxobacter sp. Fw109-5]|uniref:VOC family protein n=1 Tax=Anaeromyxobacter sp. (strain Fw109-5) TaxID=404589 RepID=UPI0000ED7D2A|nr:VOC family protein [Anaeromyxobacter sp. Fw109-5]ABS25858.1 Glyoxalase/bleomycin resistance protein/dioxygenase [Anaeromyxobacter sp. Fw109-5]